MVEHYGSEKAARAVLEERLKHHVDKARAAVKRAGWKFLCADGVRKLSPFKRNYNRDIYRDLSPVARRPEALAVQAREVVRSVRQDHTATIGLSEEEAIQVKLEFIAWQDRYDDCRERFLRGENVIWPAGTWAMVQFFGQTAEPG